MLVALLAAASLLGGTSVEDRDIRAVRTGDADAPQRVLVVGELHGSEPAGRSVVRALRRSTPPRDTQVWTVLSANPDGHAAGTRHNARGVDLNRNFPHRWSPDGPAVYAPGRAAASEPETQAMMRLVRRIDPDVTIWYHQALNLVNLVPRADHDIIRAYGRRTGLPARRLPHYRGTATSWQNKTFGHATAFVVELGAGALTSRQIGRHVDAVHRSVSPPRSRAAQAAEPPIEEDLIPFGRKRRRDMARYSERHYGERAFRLTDVRTIVEHITVSSTYASVHNTFAPNVPDGELGELPGTCAHFVVDTDGTIYQLVRLGIRCRHTVGLNDRSIGIEHVATTDVRLMGNRRQLSASLRLTRWLQDRYDVPTRHVIGHSESLSSPFHHERVKRLRTQTHGDMQPQTMRTFRRRLG